MAITSAQQYTTPVPILKQINRHNEDGSYSYGYEAADGTFKIETKYPNGEVYGKYGYVDDTGKLREIEYGASQRGFEPQGSEINVAPPTLNSQQNQAAIRPLGPNEEDDGQYREDPSVYYKDEKYNQPQSIYKNYQQPSYQQPSLQQQSFQQPSFQQQNYQQQQPTFSSKLSNNFQSYQQPQQPAFRPQFNSFATQRSYNPPPPPAYPNYNQFQGHPAQNVDIYSGSYTVQYRR